MAVNYLLTKNSEAYCDNDQEVLKNTEQAEVIPLLIPEIYIQHPSGF